MRSFAAVLTALVISGCGTKVLYTPTNPPPRPLSPRQPATVEVHATAIPARPYVEIGIITVEGRNENVEMPEIIDALRLRAAREGCDAVVLGGATARVTGSHTESAEGVSGSIQTLRGRDGVCIVYTGPPAPPPPPPPPPGQGPVDPPPPPPAPVPPSSPGGI